MSQCFATPPPPPAPPTQSTCVITALAGQEQSVQRIQGFVHTLCTGITSAFCTDILWLDIGREDTSESAGEAKLWRPLWVVLGQVLDCPFNNFVNISCLLDWGNSGLLNLKFFSQLIWTLAFFLDHDHIFPNLFEGGGNFFQILSGLLTSSLLTPPPPNPTSLEITQLKVTLAK